MDATENKSPVPELHLNDVPSEDVSDHEQNPARGSAATSCSVTPSTTPIPWQRTSKTISERGRYLLSHDDTLVDVSFLVGADFGAPETMKAHSEVFEKMFYGHFKEAHLHNGAGDQELPSIPVPDVDPAAFRNILRYMYTDDVSGLTGDNVLSTLHAAKKYVLPVLSDACVAALKKVITPDSSIAMLKQANFFDDAALIQYCLDTIDSTIALVVESDAWLKKLDRHALAQIISRDTLKMKEFDIYKAVEKWAKHQCDLQGMDTSPNSLREVLGSLLKLIRFPLMTHEEIANGPMKAGMLFSDEIASLFAYFHSTPKPQIPFNLNERCGKKYQVTAARFHRVNERHGWSYRGNSDVIGFQVDQPAELVGIGLFGDEKEAKLYSGSIRLYDETVKSGVVYREEYQFTTVPTELVYKVTFKKPLKVTMGVAYLVAVQTRGPPSPQGEHGREQLIINLEPGSGGGNCGNGGNGKKITIKFMEEVDPEARPEGGFHTARGYKTNVQVGQIPELYFTVEA